ncbi:polar amino acid transport system substrate-binding protein [Kineococcus xinjiangensis]|uniref:Polar amino acid transport system substrate-binding protein n=1 Tax=Kineococcus xinjiangensis TaxID=512762 RepID=A0A2S6IWI1_9ACTN|nr:ABC transporter substrate-binding protein [Kineococcus xinjiangensis]PPK98712.1 polar amino acid transport system substrate-binding protein [Kineococcus xinjiangensis]
MAHRRSFLLMCGTVAATALAVTSCGSDSLSGAPSSPGSTGSPTSSAAAPSADTSLQDSLPQALKDSGVLRVGTNAEYPPNEYLEGGEVAGLGIDVMNAVAAKLGLETEYTNAPFDSLIIGVAANRYDAAVSSFTINEERKKEVNMVSYFEAGSQWATLADNPSGLDPASPCGKRVAVQTGTVQADEDLPARNKECVDAGKPAIEVLTFSSQQDATAALVANRVDATVADSPIIAYAVKQTNGQLEAVGDVYDSAPYGIVIPKDQPELAEAVAEALKALEEDGTYAQVLQKWGNEDGAIDDFAVNP